ncbi:hypothetical protein BJV78DRAFT_1157378 [Lactifluus subvellereus]|nr:hypothetical protein BJV78DRAFT_1157378 [Lactifluus subvellereus]
MSFQWRNLVMRPSTWLRGGTTNMKKTIRWPNVGTWQKDADHDGIILVGLFSAAVAALVAATVVDLKQNPQDTPAFYLENMYKLQVLADPNISRPFIPSTPTQPPPFSPPKYVIWVNSLWFLSLAISLTCAMLATMPQQWARRYLRATQPPRYTSPHRRARIRTFYADGVDKLRLSWQLNHPAFFSVVWWIGVSAVAYLGIAFMPIFRLGSPYYTPLTSIVGLLRHKEKMAEEAVQNKASKVDRHILEWTCDTLVEDDELERFFS